MNKTRRIALVIGVVVCLPLTMAAECEKGKPQLIKTVVRKQHQVPGKGIKVERWCVHLDRSDGGKREIDCTLSKAEYDRTSIGDKR